MEASNMNEKCQKIFEEMEMLVPNADFMKIKKQSNGKRSYL